jgi:hypothetical protein
VDTDTAPIPSSKETAASNAAPSQTGLTSSLLTWATIWECTLSSRRFTDVRASLSAALASRTRPRSSPLSRTYTPTPNSAGITGVKKGS